MYSYLKSYCATCGKEFDGMKAYGREGHCCCSDCFSEFGWRKTLAILGKPYEPRPSVREAAERLMAESK